MSLLPNVIHESWNDLLTDDFNSKLCEIEQRLDSLPKHHCGYAYFPTKNNIMRFLSQDVNSIKCVILGMEPYPSWYTTENGIITPIATGRSFEISNIFDWKQKFKQTSLRNILRTVYMNKTGEKKSIENIRKEIIAGTFIISNPHKWFDKLEESGVMFLNATLTVEPAKPDSHTDMWKEIANEIITYIDSVPGVKWLLFGNKAQERLESAIGQKDNMYKCSHPRVAGFVDENIFKNISDIEWVV